MADFRSERMPSPEGEGHAKEALEAGWEAFYATNRQVNKPIYAVMPWLKTLGRGYATSQVFDLFGFWVMWRLSGGFEGMQKSFGMSRSSLYRRIALFREVFGEHPDVMNFPGIAIDPVEFATGMTERQKKS